MSTQTPLTPKGSRNPKRQQKKADSPHPHAKPALLTTPPSSPPRGSSPAGAFVEYNACYGDQSAVRKKNIARSTNKSRENTDPSTGVYVNEVNHRHTSSQPSITSPPRVKDSPHYAGPTFHASPAPSALPIPSFFSKSVPDSGLSAALELDSEADGEAEPEMSPSKPKSGGPRVGREHEPSPLDFLFKAALDARDKPQQSPQQTQQRPTPSTDSKANRRPDSAANGIFSLEMDEQEKDMSIGPAFATPYKERMNALRSTSSPSQPTGNVGDDQRRAKAAALKDLLLNPRPQRPASVSPHVPNPFHDANSRQPGHYYGAPLRTSSGPPTPVSFHGPPPQQGMASAAARQLDYSYGSPIRGDPRQLRTPSSALRQEISSSASNANANTMSGNPFSSHSPGPYRAAASRPVHQPPTPQRVSPHPPTPSHPTELDTKKMEDDLRRILKLEATGGIRPNGVQSSFA